jgi:tRNA(fMet)-specific endonuclease VapC
MGICLDTNVFSTAERSFFEWVFENQIYAYLPSIAYMELAYHRLKRGESIPKLNNFLDGYSIEVVPFDIDLAQTAAKKALPRHDLSEHAMDYAIGAYAEAHNFPLITYNKKHFAWLKEVYTPEELMEKLS